jgi:hypothetical protein
MNRPCWPICRPAGPDERGALASEACRQKGVHRTVADFEELDLDTGKRYAADFCFRPIGDVGLRGLGARKQTLALSSGGLLLATQNGHTPVTIARPKADARSVETNPSVSNSAGRLGDPIQRDTFRRGFAIVNG